MNGWFMQRPEHWPPPTNIDPLLISVHLTHNHDAYRIMLQPSALDYFHEHGPVGCRDLHTLELLSDAGVDAYFSGCLTLTLEKDPAWKPRRDLVLFVNAFDDERPYRKARKRLRVAGRLGRPRVPTCALRDYVGDETREILAPELLRDGLVVSNNDAIEMNPLRRYAMARQLLELFATARVVVTTKLHCALPCLAYGTPVIFIDPQHRREWRFGTGTTHSRTPLASRSWLVPCGTVVSSS
jgi:hypothetical protein